jgi:hypothetical protein
MADDDDNTLYIHGVANKEVRLFSLLLSLALLERAVHELDRLAWRRRRAAVAARTDATHDRELLTPGSCY